MVWTHLPQRSDMFAVFDVIRKVGTDKVVSETKVLKLVRGGELFVSIFSHEHLLIEYSLTSILKEQVEFPNLQDQARMDEECALTQPISDNFLRVLVIVKRPLLALRYTLPDGQIRKTQMNFVPFSGCDVALENFKAAGLPIRDKDLPQPQDQRPQSAPSQHYSQERLGTLNARQSASSQSSQGAFPGSSQPISQEGVRVRNYASIPSAVQSTNVNARPISAPGGVNQDEFSRPISASSRSTLDAFRSTSAITAVPAIGQLRTGSGLLPSPVFNGAYKPFGSVEVRPMSAPEQTQTLRDHNDSLSISQMLPPVRTLPFPAKKTHPFTRDEVASQEDTSPQKPATKMIARLKIGSQAQPAKPRKSRATLRARTNSSNPVAPSSPSSKSREKGKAPSSSAPSKARVKATVPCPETQAIPPCSEPPAPSSKSRKRSLTDRSANQPNKRQAQTSTEPEKLPDALTTAVPEQSLLEHASQATDTHSEINNHALLDTIDNHMRKYDDFLAFRSPSLTAKEQLVEYFAQSDEEREKAIENMIRTCLEDDSFSKLMDDVEKVWKKIGMGP